MGDVVNIKPVRLEENLEFVQDCCRFQESILTEANMRLKYRNFTDNVWQDLGSNEKLLEAVEAEKIRRVRTGQCKRERAQGLVVKGPAILDSIASDVSNSPRHRVDALKVLNDFAANPQNNGPAASDRFLIQINLGADVDGKPIIERFDKSIAIDANDGDPNGGFVMPQKSVAAIADKPWDDSDVAAAMPTHTGYRAATHKAAPDKRPIKTTEHEPGRAKSPQEIALEAMMNRGWD